MGGPPPFFDLAFLVTAKAGKTNDPDSVLVALRSALSECGFEVEWMAWPSSEEGESLMQVFLPFEILGDIAEQQGTRRPLKGGPNDGLFKAFRKDEVDRFTGAGTPDTIFPASIRQKLVRYALDEKVKRKLAEKLNIPFRGSEIQVPSATTPKPGLMLFEDVGLAATLKTEGLVRDMLYVHQEDVRKSLMDKWCSSYLWEQPLDEVREYYGARIAMYFAFLGHYTKCLAVPAISGVALYLYRKYTGTIDNLPTILYSLMLTIWSTIFLARWKRFRSNLVFRWVRTLPSRLWEAAEFAIDS
ncbi:hypothetical protein CYMTET_38191 [Cymbomonas tetramitiformis]|uniref:Anoctamin transmembrane domain-containing protein n=1 Tax=Cymbomonas tetramitiformis TaxID=36881 RepID=A0AAE0CCE9_9CHLO|nr:hypothetical protein CYMTET_38191 [Cymbomonas tetramitiformis]